MTKSLVLRTILVIVSLTPLTDALLYKTNLPEIPTLRSEYSDSTTDDGNIVSSGDATETSKESKSMIPESEINNKVSENKTAKLDSYSDESEMTSEVLKSYTKQLVMSSEEKTSNGGLKTLLKNLKKCKTEYFKITTTKSTPLDSSEESNMVSGKPNIKTTPEKYKNKLKTTTAEFKMEDINSNEEPEMITDYVESTTIKHNKPRKTEPSTAMKTATPIFNTTQKTTTSESEIKCHHNERLNNCPSACAEKSCDNMNPAKCNQKIKIKSNCRPECRCRSHYYRDSEGYCVTASECGTMTTVTTSMIPITLPELKCGKAYFRLANAILRYQAKILNTLYNLNHKGSIMTAAFTLHLISEMVFVASFDTYKQMLKGFNLRCLQEVGCLAQSTFKAITTKDKTTEYGLMSEIYASNECPFTEEFNNKTKNIYPIRPENLNFSDPQSAEIISNKVAKLTAGLVVDFPKPKMLKSATSKDSLLLVTAESFKGIWKDQFDLQYTKLMKFNTSDGKTVIMPMMYQMNRCLYTESTSINAKIARLKFTNEYFTFVMFIPNTNISDFLKKVANIDEVTAALDNMRMENVKIYLPRFNVTVVNTLKKPYLKAGIIPNIFNNKTAGLQKVTSCTAPYVSENLEKLVLIANEKGMGQTKMTEIPERIEKKSDSQTQNEPVYTCKADKPFYYCLYYDRLALLCGVYKG